MPLALIEALFIEFSPHKIAKKQIFIFMFGISQFILSMYKIRNTGTGDGTRGTQGMGGMLYSGECHQTFRGMSMSENKLENVHKYFREFC